MQALLCSIAVVACVLVSHPFAEMGVNDDWSYVWSAKLLAETGHIHYSGWAQPILGWQLYLAALLIKLFGFSFSVVRIAVLLIAATTAFFLQRSFVRAGLTTANASMGTLCLVLSPLYLPLAFIFMSDLGGFFSVVLCLYGCLRAFQAGTDERAFAWWAFAAFAGVLTGTVRQIAWLGPLVMVPSAAWCLRGKLPRVGAVAVYLCSLVMIFSCLHWYAHQPYAMRQPLFDFYPDRDAAANMVSSYTHAALALSFLLLPLFVAFAIKLPGRQARLAPLLLLCLAVASLLVVAFAHAAAARDWLAPFTPFSVTDRGLVQVDSIIGRPQLVVPLSVRVLVTVLSFTCTAAFLAWLAQRNLVRERASSVSAAIGMPTLARLLLPFSAAYCLLLVSRAAQDELFDRYLFPLLAVAVIFVVRFYQRHVGDRLPVASALAIALLALFGIAGLHDLYATERARLAAVAELHVAHVPDREFYGGVEYDGWTQLVLAGHANSRQILQPANAFQPLSPFLAGHPCGYRYTNLIPIIQARYILSYEQNGCAGPTSFAPVTFATWLPPFHQTIYIDRMRSPSTQ